MLNILRNVPRLPRLRVKRSEGSIAAFSQNMIALRSRRQNPGLIHLVGDD